MRGAGGVDASQTTTWMDEHYFLIAWRTRKKERGRRDDFLSFAPNERAHKTNSREHIRVRTTTNAMSLDLTRQSLILHPGYRDTTA